MQRDLDLVRKILLGLEKHPAGFAPDEFSVEGYSQEQVAFHVYLLGQVEFLKVANPTTRGSSSPSAIPVSITWDGYEFLAAAREASVWNAAKAKLGGFAGAVGLDVLKATLVQIIHDRLGLP